MVERNEGIERDVQRYLERKKIEHEVLFSTIRQPFDAEPCPQIELLEVLIPIQNYRELRSKYLEAKVEQRKLHEKVMKLKAKNEPAHNLFKSATIRSFVEGLCINCVCVSRKLETEYKELDKTRDAITKSTRAKFKKMTDKHGTIEKLVSFLSFRDSDLIAYQYCIGR